VSDIVTGLFCVLVTLGVVPYIRCPRGGAAEVVAAKLDGRLRETLSQRGNLFAEASAAAAAAAQPAAAASRPLLCLFDRSFDCASCVQHSWTYQPLCADVLGLRLNRVAVQVAPPPAPKKAYELDVDGDPFWAGHLADQFPKVAEEVEAELQRYKADVAAVNRATEEAAGGEAGGGESSLLTAVSTLPELTERKRMIDKHTGVATALLGAIKARSLDSFYSVEEELLSGRAPDRAALAQLLDPAKGLPEDRLRLAIVQALAAEGPPAAAAEAEAADAQLRAGGCDTAALAYVRHMRAFGIAGAAGGGGGGAGGAGAAAGVAGGASQGALLDWADKLYGQGLTAVTKGMTRLLAGSRQLAVPRAVEALQEGKPGGEAADFLCFDPKAPRGGPGAPPPPGAGRRDAIVCLLGGGSFLEHRALQEAAGRAAAAPGAAPGAAILYGATEMLSPADFVAQLAELGRKTSARAL